MRLLVCLSLSASACFAQLQPWNQATVSAWWQQHPAMDSWAADSDELKAQLTADYQRRGTDALGNSDFQHWLRHWQWVQLGLTAGDLLKNDTNRDTFITLGKDDTVAHLFAAKIQPASDAPRAALENLLRLAQANLSDLREYPALGVAFALVFDQPFPKRWPHHQVAAKVVPVGDTDVVARFQFYIDANRQSRLAQDIAKLNFDEVKFMVDCPITLDELRYGQSNKSARVNYTNFDQAFSAIQYDETRVKDNRQLYDWPGDSYRLADLERLGGICVDQAYYAAILGKARGIPTLYFSGQGANGGHAWFGFLQRNGRWSLDCGRYASQNYPIGYALDPQTWQRLSDVTLQNLTRNISRDDKFEAAQAGLAWAKLNADSALYPKILQDTLTIMPELAEAWELKGDWLDQHADAPAQREFYEAWIKQFSANRDLIDLKVSGQTRLLALLKQTNDPAAAQLQQDLILYNRKKRFDLGIGAGAEALSEKLTAGDWQAARLEYERLVRTFDRQGGGNLFYQIVRPYIRHCLEEHQPQLARQGLKYAQSRMNINNDSILAEEFTRLENAIKAAREQQP